MQHCDYFLQVRSVFSFVDLLQLRRDQTHGFIRRTNHSNTRHSIRYFSYQLLHTDAYV